MKYAKYPNISPAPIAGKYILTNCIGYKWEKTFILVKKGLVTDGASIPRICWTTTGSPFLPSYIRAAIIHDYLYKTQKIPRKTVDGIFRDILKEDGISFYQRSKMYWALRSFGWFMWRSKK